MAIKAPLLCQAHAGPVVKPLQKQDAKTKMQTMLECVGRGGDPRERKLSSACFTVRAACTAQLHPMGVGGGWRLLAFLGQGGMHAQGLPRQAGRPPASLCSAYRVQTMPCLQLNVSLLALRPRAKERPLCLRIDFLVPVHLVWMLAAPELPPGMVPACAGPKPCPEPSRGLCRDWRGQGSVPGAGEVSWRLGLEAGPRTAQDRGSQRG